jgi:hypothetical protein
MKFSLLGLVRMTVLLALVSGAVALGVARLEPRPARFRLFRPSACAGINGTCFAMNERGTQFFHTGTGAYFRVAFPDGDLIDETSISPWQDEQGETQVVGRWIRWEGSGERGGVEALGLARYKFPSGEPIDRVRLEMLPVGKPCWLPGPAARVLFGAGDRRLYRLDFEEERGGEGREMSRPRPVTWRCRPPGVGEVCLEDPFWPTDPRLGRRVLVSLSYQVRATGRPLHSDPRIWWLELDAEGTSIEAAGPLTEPDCGTFHHGRVTERLPNLAEAPDGGLALAYLTRAPCAPHWTLRIAPVEIDRTTRLPRARTAEGRPLDDRCLTSPPTFSVDGHWVYAVRRSDRTQTEVERFSVPSALVNGR